MDKSITQSPEHVGWVNKLVFNLVVEQCYFFLTTNATSVVQPLDQGIIASFKVQFKKKLLE